MQPGETLAVVGTSGSGKSTISLLLPRFYDVRGGAVRVGGHDVRDLTIDSLRASIGLVMEDSFLFSDTIRANISLRPARRDAGADRRGGQGRGGRRVHHRLPDGYDTVIGEQGLTLSGGQRQRVSLARALITDPAILILDDATSAIDAAVEAQIHATLRRVMAGRTTLLIAHRRSTLQLADRIAVLDEGRLVDLGTHEELTERCPLYRLLLAGPGEDAEGVDAGELAYQRERRPPRSRCRAGAGSAVTPALWDRPRPGRVQARAACTATQLARVARRRHRPRHGRRRPGQRPRRQRGRVREHARGDPGHARAARQGGRAAARQRSARGQPRGFPRRGSAVHAAPAAAADRAGAVRRPGP